MTKSTRIQIITEIVGALAVVVTLIFLIVEIQQNTEQTRQNARAVEMAAYQDLIGQIHQLNSMQIENYQFVEVLDRYMKGGELNSAESRQIQSFTWALFRHGDMAYYQYERGIITEERLVSVLNPVIYYIRTNEAIRKRWDLRKNMLVPGYQNYLDTILAASERALGEQSLEEQMAATRAKQSEEKSE